jgi:WW domain-containing oxidoreductase
MSLLAALKEKGANGFGYGSTAEEVIAGLQLDGKTVLITGVSSGIGHEAARVLALRGARVLGTGRSLESAQTALARLSGTSAGFACELSDPASVRACVAAVKADCARTGKKLDVILCNAGIMALPKLTRAHGFEQQFFTNHIGHFLLVTGLLDVLADDGRVVMVSSAAHRRAPPGAIQFDNLTGAEGYSPGRAYGQSKMANLLFAKELARRFAASGSARKAYAVHPGVIHTNLGRHMSPVANLVLAIARPLVLKSEAQGSATQVMCAVHPFAQDKSGAYFADCQVAEPRPDALDPEIAGRLWQVSEEICARV